MPTLYIIAGPNGAGKTTFTRRFLAGENSVFEFVNADSIAQGLAPYEPEKAALAAGRLMLTRLRELFDRRESFAFETKLSGRAYRLLLTEMKAAGYRIELDFLWLPVPEQSITRVARRVIAGGHHIPEEVIRRRHTKGLQNLFQIYRSLLNRWTLYENTDSRALTIAREDDGSLVVWDIEEFAKITDLVDVMLRWVSLLRNLTSGMRKRCVPCVALRQTPSSAPASSARRSFTAIRTVMS